MNNSNKVEIGIYEKAFPKKISVTDKLIIAKKANFDFLELSIDESDEKIERLYWEKDKRERLKEGISSSGTRINSMCLSAHRKFPFGSVNKEKQEKSKEIMEKAIELSLDLGIRTIQLAGYDVYYEESSSATKENFLKNLDYAVDLASKANVMLALETMDTKFLNSISAYKEIAKNINSPWLKVYPDIGNLSAWNLNLESELKKGINDIVAIHLKDTLPVSDNFEGKFRDIPFGEGKVDFEKAFKILNELEYKGPFLVEMWGESNEGNVEKQLRDVNLWIRNKMKKGGLNA